MASPKKASLPDVELVPDAWAKFEKFVKGIAKAGPQHRPALKAKAKAARKKGSGK